MLAGISIVGIGAVLALSLAVIRQSGKLAAAKEREAEARSEATRLGASLEREEARAAELATQLLGATRDATAWRQRYRAYAASMRDRIETLRTDFIASADRDTVARRLAELGESAHAREKR